MPLAKNRNEIYTGKVAKTEKNLGKRIVLDLSNHLSCFKNLQKEVLGPSIGMLKKNRKSLPKAFYKEKLEKNELKCLAHKEYRR